MNNNNTFNKWLFDWLNAWTGNDPSKLIAFYDDLAFYSDPAKPLGLKGKEAIFTYFSKLLTKYPDWVWKAVEVFNHDSGFTLKWCAQLNPKTPLFYGLDIVVLKDSKILRNEVYFNPNLLLSGING